MKTITINEIKLEVPDSEVEELVKKYSKKETVEDLLRVEKGSKVFFINHDAIFIDFFIQDTDTDRLSLTESLSGDQLSSLCHLNLLANVARKLNDGWIPNLNIIEDKYYIYISKGNCINISKHEFIKASNVYFKSEELAQKAIDLLGEESIKKALTLNYK